MFTHFGLWELLPANRIMRRKSSRETFSFKFSELLLWKQIYTEGSHSSSKDTESTLVPFYVHVLDGFLFFDFLGDTSWKISPKWQELPTCAIYFSPWPSGLLRPGKTSGEKIISHWTLIISIILESESSDRVKHGFCKYRVFFFTGPP